MKKRRVFTTVLLTIFLVITNVFCMSETVHAKAVKSAREAEKLAKKKVKGATVLKIEREKENGVLVYEVEMMKGKKEYDLTYRASDGKLISYGWEIQSWYIKNGSGKIMSLNKCRKLAQKEVSGGKIISIVKKRSNRIDIYKVKLQKGNKTYELKYHARTGKLLEYDWEINTRSNNDKKYIGEKRAKQIALEEVGGGTVVKIEFDIDDGVPVYEVEIVDEEFEYEVVIHAKTGAVLEMDAEYIDD